MRLKRAGVAAVIAGFFLAGAGAALAGLETVWTQTYGGASNDGLRSVCETTDGCFAAVGYTYSFGPSGLNIYVVKVDAEGDTIWTRAIGGSGRDYGWGICQGVDGGCVIAGYTTSSGAGREDVYVASIDADGAVVWEETYGGNGSDEGRTILRTSDGCFLVAGLTDSYGAGQSDSYLLKLNAEGDTVWTRVFGGAQSDWAESCCQAADGCYFICGTTGSNGLSRDIYVTKVDAAGTTVWQRFYGDFSTWISQDFGGAVVAEADGGLAVAGSRIILSTDPLDVYFLRADSLGVQIALKRYASPFIEYGLSMCGMPDGGYLICGADKNEVTLKNDLLLVKRVTGSGWGWEQVIGGSGSDWGSCIIETDPGQYLIAGHTECSGAGGYDGWLLMMREADAGVPGISSKSTEVWTSPSPNPFRGGTEIRFALPSASEVGICIYNFAGRRVKTICRGPFPAGGNAASWDGCDDRGERVAPGIYLVRITAGESSAVIKLVRLPD